MIDFVATATQWSGELSSWVTATGSYELISIITAIPRWFSELPEDVQSIKLEEGDAWASILKKKTIEIERRRAEGDR